MRNWANYLQGIKDKLYFSITSGESFLLKVTKCNMLWFISLDFFLGVFGPKPMLELIQTNTSAVLTLQMSHPQYQLQTYRSFPAGLCIC